MDAAGRTGRRAEPGGRITILLADDHALVREGLRQILSARPETEVVDEARDGDEVMAKIIDTTADVLLLDVSMPGPGFFSVMRAVCERRPDLRVLVLSVQPESTYALRALEAGAAGYMTKNHSADELVRAIERVATGGTYVSAGLAEELVIDRTAGAPRPAHERLSSREFQVLCKLAAGEAIKEIAADLGVSSKTVTTYRARVLDKLGLRTNADLVRYAVEHDLDR